MPVSFAILLDGGFLRRKLGTTRRPVDAAGISAFPTEARLTRIFWADNRVSTRALPGD